MASQENLRELLISLDHRGYKAYKDIRGSYNFPNFTLIIDRVQGDPFATPSQLRVKIPQAIAKFPRNVYQNRSREIALRDYITREFYHATQSLRERRGTGNSGLIAIALPTQAILDRTSAFINDEFVEIRFVVGLPGDGRRINAPEAVELLCEQIPQLIEQTLIYSNLDAAAIENHITTAEDADFIRDSLREKKLVAFVGDGAILPRRSGVDERPLLDQVIPFKSPDSLSIEFNCPNRGLVTGMGIPQGVTLIVGGGYHGKSTLLRAIELGIYNHIPNDGRELVVTNSSAVKIRAEDGRSITGVDISPFINHLPQNRSTTNFSTQNASGSTSQAANIIEALEAGTQLLLVDEDTAATNFMIRDRRMQALIAKDFEPITPFIDKVRQLYTEYNVSTILVMGGSGDYFDVADTVIAMQDFQPSEVTDKAKAIAQQYTTNRTTEGGQEFGKLTARVLLANKSPSNFNQYKREWKVRDLDTIIFNREEIDLSGVEQLVEVGQLRAIAATISYIEQHYLDHYTLPEILDSAIADITTQSFDILTSFPEGNFVFFRRLELAAAINRWRSLNTKPKL
ncbi:ABC transporter, ATPase [Crinalium epipsammum PCC 9333]|uniref:ABC transporter, ATPase n=1 Tax=Crinalium epipsammum PCC 9333 TaxID=1173022 RepID=K9VVD5_9CYAN|nr:ABC-ATPase domain-containing protein [Crinalium epipsammum]AFZ12048.1 ABC transporter, ATPase [Crinalium epipsammum PCC 9333]